MTCKELLAKEHPEKISDIPNGGCYGCPSTYGYVSAVPCADHTCDECWNGEVVHYPGKTNTYEYACELQPGMDIHGKVSVPSPAEYNDILLAIAKDIGKIRFRKVEDAGGEKI